VRACLCKTLCASGVHVISYVWVARSADGAQRRFGQARGCRGAVAGWLGIGNIRTQPMRSRNRQIRHEPSERGRRGRGRRGRGRASSPSYPCQQGWSHLQVGRPCAQADELHLLTHQPRRHLGRPGPGAARRGAHGRSGAAGEGRFADDADAAPGRSACASATEARTARARGASAARNRLQPEARVGRLRTPARNDRTDASLLEKIHQELIWAPLSYPTTTPGRPPAKRGLPPFGSRGGR
jgi:hypothetical protein